MLKDRTLELVDKDPLGIVPNGIAISPKEDHVYVGGSGKIIRYDVRSDDSLATLACSSI